MDNGEVYYRRYLEGDRNAIYDIVADYREGLVLFINKYVNDFCTAEELAEDALFKIFHDKPEFSGKCTFKTWLYTIGKNAALNSIAKRSKHPEVPLDDFYDISDKENIERNHIKGEEKRQLFKAMDKLKPEYKQVLYLSYYEYFSNTEIAEIMGKSERQIRNLLYRAKKALRKELEKEGFKYEGI